MTESKKTVEQIFNIIKVQTDDFEKKCHNTCRDRIGYSDLTYGCFEKCAELTNKRTQILIAAMEAASPHIKISNNQKC